MSPFQVSKLSKKSGVELRPTGQMGKLCKITLGKATSNISVLALALRECWELPLGLAARVLLKEIVLKWGGGREMPAIWLKIDQHLPKIIHQRHFHSHIERTATCDRTAAHHVCKDGLFPCASPAWVLEGIWIQNLLKRPQQFPSFHSKPWRNFLHHPLVYAFCS